MEVVLANPRGFCAGVDRAIEIVEVALARYGAPIYVRHEIVHNQYVVDDLRAKGAVFIDDPADAPEGALLIYSAHGVSPAVREAARARGLRTIDGTCPLVTKVHVETLRMLNDGYEVVLVGHAGHVEVEGTQGHAPDRIHLIQDVADVAALEVRDPDKLGCVTQTTLSVDDTREVIEALAQRFPNIRLPRKDDICYATQNRQNAVKKLLDELTRKAGIAAHMVQNGDAIDPAWLAGVECVGVTASASTPELLVEQVVERLRKLSGGEVALRSLPQVDEGVAFQIPPELR
ncbi:MAG: 4-hydroxy-3-methylbut-2-enyl diphosphate reductase [Deltaproteobacteria bacterium]|nr:MAG: 4-hydroxy-3-methylbut-2-enyl diphosphate reductase [Deltaproteobacteria bacterium]